MECAGPGVETPRWQGARLSHSRSYGARSATQPARMDRRPDSVLHLGSGS